ncbi:MAG: hypothetical protein GX364_05575 [Firmicutes bacterium]|nr:hypothetical protein [Bacillota bacterium]
MEEQEIRLRDLVEIVWRGRLPIIIITSLAVILTLIYSIVVQKPLFEGVVRVNTTQFNYPVYDLVDETAQSNLWVQFLSEVEGIPDPVAAAGRVRIEPLVYTEKVAGENQTVEIEKADLVEVRFCYPDAVLAGEAANHIGEELLKYTKERRLEILHDKKEELTKGLEMLDEKLAKMYPDAYALVTRQDGDSDALFGVSVTEGSMNVRLVELDPSYRRLAAKRGEDILALNAANLEIDKLENSELMEISNWVFPGRVPAAPVPGRRLLKVAVAFIFGLVLSIFVVFFSHYMSNGYSPDRRKEIRGRKIKVNRNDYRVDGR